MGAQRQRAWSPAAPPYALPDDSVYRRAPFPMRTDDGTADWTASWLDAIETHQTDRPGRFAWREDWLAAQEVIGRR